MVAEAMAPATVPAIVAVLVKRVALLAKRVPLLARVAILSEESAAPETAPDVEVCEVTTIQAVQQLTVAAGTITGGQIGAMMGTPAGPPGQAIGALAGGLTGGAIAIGLNALAEQPGTPAPDGSVAPTNTDPGMPGAP